MIYLDYMASTPVAPEVATQMARVLTDKTLVGNPSTLSHASARAARQVIDHAREQVAALINAEPESIIWTSGATEGNNLALQGLARGRANRGKHIIISAIEHPSVSQCAKKLGEMGYRITTLKPDASGILTLEQLEAALKPDTILVSIMHVNNEIGVIQPIEQFAECLAQKDILFHVDAVQSTGRLPIDLQKTPIAAMTFSAHKLYGPKGVGALYLRQRPKVRCLPLCYGGAQEKRLRPGTLATHQIVGMGQAFELAGQLFEHDKTHNVSLQTQVIDELKQCGDYVINGCMRARVPNNLNLAFTGIDAKTLLAGLQEQLAFSLGAACNTHTLAPSQILRILGHDLARANSSLRLSWGRYTTPSEIQIAFALLKDALQQQRNA